jgi:hypothetical protein
MTENEILKTILQKLTERSIPIEVDLWGTEHIAAYLKRSYTMVRDKIIVRLISRGRPRSTRPRNAPIRCTRRARSSNGLRAYRRNNSRVTSLAYVSPAMRPASYCRG